MPVKRSKKLEIARRRQGVADLYVQGWTQTDLAVEFDVAQSTICDDLKKIQAEWRDSRIRDFDTARTLELQKIDRIEREAWAAWERSQQPAQSAIVTGNKETRKSVKHQHGDPRFLELVSKCVAQRRALLGLDVLPASMETNTNATISIDTRRDRVVAIVAQLRERGGIGPAGAGPGPLESGGLCLEHEPG